MRAMDPIETLPPELFELVLQDMDVGTIQISCRVCRKWNNFIQKSDRVWKNMCRSFCNMKLASEDRMRGLSWKETFKKNYGPAETKKLWISGTFSNPKCSTELSIHKMFPLTCTDWEEILDAELSR